MWRYTASARDRNLEFRLTEEQCKQLFEGNCYFCNVHPCTKIKRTTGEEFIYNGIDRLNPNKGYIFENCVSCCQQCNYMKQDYTKDEFIQKCKEIARIHA